VVVELSLVSHYDADMEGSYIGVWGGEVQALDEVDYSDDTTARFGEATARVTGAPDPRPYGEYVFADGWVCSRLVAHTVTRMINRCRHRVCVPFFGPEPVQGN
jgi:hypothetical protein